MKGKVTESTLPSLKFQQVMTEFLIQHKQVIQGNSLRHASSLTALGIGLHRFRYEITP